MKVFITGAPASGKTVVARALSRKGYTAFSTEELPGLNQHFDTLTNKIVQRPPAPVDYGRYQNIWNLPKLKGLLAKDDLVFIADLNSTQTNYYGLFDKIIGLTLDEATQRKRLANRQTNSNNYGKHPKELAAVLAYRETFQHELRALPNCQLIDATQPLNVIVDEILSYTHDRA